MQAFGAQKGLPLVRALAEYAEAPEGQRVRAKAGRFLSIMNDLTQHRASHPIHELISHALHATGYLEALASEIRALVDESDTLGVEADTLAAPERLRPRLHEIGLPLTAAPSRHVIVIKSPVGEPSPEGGG